MIDIDLIKWLDSHINFEIKPSRRATMPTLERIELLLKYIGDPQKQVNAIHLTGTNGKTSTSRIAESLLRTKGLSTSTITSPHLFELSERICLNGKPVDSEILNSALWILKNTEENVEEIQLSSPSWFEIIIAASFYIMENEAVDVGLVEVGMGGLYDATNVIDSLVSVVTNVELDHMNYLGNTRQEIAREKSGIIKEGSIAVIGETDEELVRIFEDKAREKNAQALVINEHFELFQNDQAIGGRLLSFNTPYARYEEMFLPLFGPHQGTNALLAVVAAESFLGGELGEDIVESGFAETKNPGRLEAISHEPLILIDGAHNVAGASALSNALMEEFPQNRRIYILGFSQEKDPEAMINALNIDDEDIVIAAQADFPRAMEASKISDVAKSLGIEQVILSDDVNHAIENAMSLALDDTQIVITGSLYLVGQLRNIIGQR